MSIMTGSFVRLRGAGAALAAIIIASGMAWAAPVAVVEDIAGPPAGVQSFDFLDEGQVIQLQPGNTLVLGYLGSCWRESIVGGTVRVGAEQSTVQGGQVGRERVECDGGRMRLTSEQASRSGAVAFRGPPSVPAQAEVFGLNPVFQLGAPGRLLIERLDRAASRIDVTVTARDLNRGLFDLARANMSLAAGGTYRARAGEREIVFRVNANARPGAVPLVARLIRF
ncbi:MAG: hypothetical protein JNL66_01040 [Alphaproteobacteria bacterium]|nr:hypothetical protein [Alphaproteobacteria bacterium]